MAVARERVGVPIKPQQDCFDGLDLEETQVNDARLRFLEVADRLAPSGNMKKRKRVNAIPRFLTHLETSVEGCGQHGRFGAHNVSVH